MPCALVLVALGSGLAALVETRWQLVLCWGVLVGIGTGCMAAVLAATVANRWFVARRGFVMASRSWCSTPRWRTGSLPLWVFIGFYGLDWVATVPPTVKLCAEVCGPEHATVAYGWVFDQTGSYQLSFVIAGVLCLVAALGTQRIGRQTDTDAVAVAA